MDVVVIGSGPNGLAAAVTLARAGLAVSVHEAGTTPGGGVRTEKWSELGQEFPVDTCSAVHPLALASPFFREFDLAGRGVEFLHPEAAYAHPLDGSRAGVAYRDLERTAEALGPDQKAWLRIFRPFLEDPQALGDLVLGDRLRAPAALARHPRGAAGLVAGLRRALTGISGLKTDQAKALLAGASAHAIARPDRPAAAVAGLFLGALAHTHGWPVARGGSQAIAGALLADLHHHGGRLELGHGIHSWQDLPRARAYVFDTSAWTLGNILASRTAKSGPGARERFWLQQVAAMPVGGAAARVDFILEEEIPWADPEVARAGTIHLGGPREQIIAAEKEVSRGRHARLPVALLADTGRVDAGRRRAGKRAVWTYAHVPRGSEVDQTEAITAQIERFAPGFRDVILASRSRTAMELARHNPNYREGDIAAGAVSLYRMVARPVARMIPYRTPWRDAFLCSASAAPGPGVHGMGGWNAAHYVLKDVFGIREMPDLAP